MANTHTHSPWRKSVLIPFWVLQILLELLIIALFVLAIDVLVNYFNGDGDLNDTGPSLGSVNTVSTHAEIVGGIWVGVLVLCLILTIAEIILLARHKLKPLTFVIMNLIKSAVWTVIFVFDVISVVDNTSSRTATVVSLIIEVILLLCFIIPLIYGSVIYHRFRRHQKSYKPVDHPYSNPTTDFGAPTAYPPQYKAFVHENDVEAHRIPGARKLSYNHQKDPRFESYRRASNSYGESSVLETTMISRSPDIPNIHIQHHDEEIFEMESRKSSR